MYYSVFVNTVVDLAIHTALKTGRQNLQKYLQYLLLSPKSDVNLKTGQNVYDNIVLWSLYCTLLLFVSMVAVATIWC
jgi:hypothetical protein